MSGGETSSALTRRTAICAAALLIAVLLAYMPAIHAGYIWDDDSYVTDNSLLHDAAGLLRIWIPRQTPQYYPMVFSSFWIEYQLWGLEPMGYHVVNVLLHIANALLLWLVLRSLGVPGAWLICAVFALHPMHVESVAWITERKNVLSLLFYLLAAGAYLRFDRMHFRSERDAGDRSAWRWYSLALLAFAAALLSKSVTCSLPAALILVMLWQRTPISRRRLLPLVPMFILGLVLALNTAMLEREHVGAVGADFDFSFFERTLIASRALLFYPWKMLWPAELIFIYPRWDIDSTALAQYLPLLALIAAGAVLLALHRRGVRGPFVAAAFYAGTIFPALGYFNVYPHLFSFVADHFAYHASIGILALVIGGGAWLVNRPAALRIAAVAILPILFVLTYQQSIVYHNEETLWRGTIAKNPHAWMPRNNLAAILLRQAEAASHAGQAELSEQLASEARQHTEVALDLRPHEHTAWSNHSEALRLLGQREQALTSIANAIEHAPHLATYHWQRGRLHHQRSEYEHAAEAFAQAVDRIPTAAEYRLDLARVLTQLDRLHEAAEQFAAVIEIEPDNYIALGTLASIRAQHGDVVAARALYLQALDAAPGLIEQVQIVTRLIRLLSDDETSEVYNPQQAIAMAEQVVALSERQDPTALAMLASVHARVGNTDTSLLLAREAIAAAEAAGLHELAAEIQRTLIDDAAQ